MISNVPDRNVSTTPWHVGITPIFPSSLLISDNAAVESLLSDIPFLAVGLLAFAVLTFLLIVRKFAAKTTPLFLSTILAFVAVVLDIDQLLVQASPTTGNSSKSNDGLTVPISSVLPLLIAREVLLGIAIGMRFLYFWVYLHSTSTPIVSVPDNQKNSVLTRTTSATGEPNFLKLQSPSPDRSLTFSNGLTSSHVRRFTVSCPPVFVLAFKYAILAAITSIPILQLLWRLVKQFNRYGGLYVATSIIEIVASIVVITTLLIGVLVDVVEKGGRLSLSWRKVGRREKLQSFIPILFAAFVELGSSIGSLLCFEFSESSLGRLLQALEVYILILYILVSTFYEKRQPSEISTRLSDIEEGDREQDANLMEKVPASGHSLSTQADTPRSFLPTSAIPVPQRSSRYRSVGSWPLSILTNRDNDTDGNSGMLSVPGSSILSPMGSIKRLSSWVSAKRRSERSMKSMSELLDGAGGGRIRSVSWAILNDPIEEGSPKTDLKTSDIADVGIPSASSQVHPYRSQLEPRDSVPSKLPFARTRASPLASRLERLATQLDSVFSPQERKRQTVSSTIPASAADRTSNSLTFQPHASSDVNEFHLTPVMPTAPDLRRSYYEEGPDPSSYSPRYSYPYDKSIRSSASDSTAEIELFLRQQQAGLDKSVAELRLLEGGDSGRLNVGNRRYSGSMTSDFSLSEFPELPQRLEQPPAAYGNERLIASSGASRTSFGDLPPAVRTSLSFPSPVIRTSVDSSVLGVNEGILTLGLGTDSDIFTRGQLGTRQLDVTSFIAAGEEGANLSRLHFRPAATSIFSPPSLSGTEDAEGVDTPPPSVVRFATKVHIPPVTSVSATISRSLSGSKSSTATANSMDEESSTRPTATMQLQTSSGAGQAHILNNRSLRRKIGIGLPSSVKPSAANPNPASARD